MQIFVWLWNGLMLIYTIGYWYNHIRRILHPGPHPLWVWGTGLTLFGAEYAYRYWQNRRDARDNYPDLRGKRPDQDSDQT